jgi:hypothetical protein
MGSELERGVRVAIVALVRICSTGRVGKRVRGREATGTQSVAERWPASR